MKRFAMMTAAYGLLRSWCWFTFLEGTAADVMTSMFTLPLHTLAVVFTAGSALFAVPAAYLLRHALSKPDRKTFLFALIGACLSIAWGVLPHPVPYGFFRDFFATLSASAGFIVLSIFCVPAFFEMGVRRAAVAQCAVSALSVVFLLPWLAMNLSVAIAYIFVFIPLSAAALVYAGGFYGPGPPEIPAPPLQRRDRIGIARYVGLSFLVNLCCGTLHSLMTSAESQAYSEFYFLSNISYFCCSLLLAAAILRFPKMRFKSICTASLPLMAAGFVLFPLLDRRFPLVCFFFIQAGFAFFNVYEWTYILSVAGLFQKRDAPLVLGIGMFLWNATTLAGLTLPERTLAFLGATLNEYPAALSAIAGLCLCLAWFLTPDDLPTKTEQAPDAAPETSPAAIVSSGCRLTRQESVIADMLAAGMKNSEMCLALNIAESTLRTHLKSIYRKTGIKKRKGPAAGKEEKRDGGDRR